MLIADSTRRLELERELWRGIERLERSFATPRPAELVIVVQQMIITDRQLAGCYQLGQLANGSRFALARVALQVNDRHLTTDELLAILAEQYIGLLIQHNPSVLVPVELEPKPAGPHRADPIPADPLAHSLNGTASGKRVA